MGTIFCRNTTLSLSILFTFYVLVLPETNAQETFKIVYENTFNDRTGFAEHHGLSLIPGGFEHAPTGTYSITDLRIFIRRQYLPYTFSQSFFTDGKLLGMNVKGNEVMTFMGNPVEVNHPALFRFYVAAEPNVAVTIGLMDFEYPKLTAQSTWEHIVGQHESTFDFSEWKVVYVLFEPKSNKVQPIIQVASSKPSSHNGFVLIDNLRIYEVPKDHPDISGLLNNEFNPLAE